jgi:hypothetical protein
MINFWLMYLLPPYVTPIFNFFCHRIGVLRGNPGRYLRNLLAYFRALHQSSNQLRVLCWRDAELPASSGMWKSRFRIVSAGPAAGQMSSQNPVRWSGRRTYNGNLVQGSPIWHP